MIHWSTLFFCLLVFACRCDLVSAKGLRPAKGISKRAVKQGLKPKRLALLVGIGSYKDKYWPALKYAESDPEKLRKALHQHAGFANHVYVLNKRTNTSTSSIHSALEKLQSANTNPDDVVLVYISAHGTVANFQNFPHRVVITADTQSNRPAATGLIVTKLIKKLSGFISQNIILMLATCYTTSSSIGTKFKLAKGVKGDMEPNKSLKSPSKAIQILSAASRAQPAFELENIGDVYTYYFVKCMKTMKDKGVSTLSSIHRCAVADTGARVKKERDEVQMPSMHSYNTENNKDINLLMTGAQPQQSGYVVMESSGDAVFKFYRPGRKSMPLFVAKDGESRTVKPGRYLVRVENQRGDYLRSYPLLVRPREWFAVSPDNSSHSIVAHGGIWVTSGLLRSGGDLSWKTGIGWVFSRSLLRLEVQINGIGTQVRFGQELRQQSGLELRAGVGLGHRFVRFSFSYGVYAAGMLLLHDVNRTQQLSGLGYYGIFLRFSFRLWREFFLHLGVDGGFAPVDISSELHIFWVSSAVGQLSWRF